MYKIYKIISHVISNSLVLNTKLLEGRIVSPFVNKSTASKKLNYRNETVKYCTNTSTDASRDRLPDNAQKIINRQIHAELYAGYTYLSMMCYFFRCDQAYRGMTEFFRRMCKEEQDHAYKFIQYQTLHGGYVCLKPIDKPLTDDWSSPLNALNEALKLEIEVTRMLQELSDLAEEICDVCLADFVMHFIHEQHMSQDELARLISLAKDMCESKLGTRLFDEEMLDTSKDPPEDQLEAEFPRKWF